MDSRVARWYSRNCFSQAGRFYFCNTSLIASPKKHSQGFGSELYGRTQEIAVKTVSTSIDQRDHSPM
jgi:hypothetical protein